MLARGRLLLLLSMFPLAAGCTAGTGDGPPAAPGAQAEDPFASGADFIAIPRAADAPDAPAGALGTRTVPAATGNESFYLAINKSVLTSNWFLSAYLKQLAPDGVAGGAARSLGTKIVTMRVQNGKLYLFDAGHSYGASPLDDQALVIDAFPLENANALKLPYSDKYVIIDPGKGQNPFTFVADAMATEKVPVKLETKLSYQQGFKALADGMQYEQVFRGYADVPVNGRATQNAYQLGGTLSLSLRRYAEGAGFVPSPSPPQQKYFLSNDWDVRDTGRPAVVTKWNIAPGMAPIVWQISPAVLEAQAAAGPGYDIVAAIKAGVESWNEAFGFTVFEARLATADMSYGDDTLNFITWDPDPSVGYAFANLRTNPDTGEIRGASVYLSSAFFAPYAFEDDVAPSTIQLPATTSRALPSLGWGTMQEQPRCSLFADDARMARTAARLAGTSTSSLTAQQKTQLSLTHTVAHEIGHALGLRHNFKGSLVPEGTAPTSVMDYLVDDDSFQRPGPGPYDVAAVRALYGLPPSPGRFFAFCTDEDVKADPDCMVFDRTDAPLTKDSGPTYSKLVDLYIETGGYALAGVFVDIYGDRVGDYARSSVPSHASPAFDILFGKTQPPLSADLMSTPDRARAAADLHARMMTRLWLTPESARSGRFVNDPQTAYVIEQTILREKDVLTNVDHVRSYESRRAAVDVLKKLRSTTALAALVDARVSIEAGRGALIGTDAILADDLLARIDAATHPYF